MKYNTIREYIEKHIAEQSKAEGLGLTVYPYSKARQVTNVELPAVAVIFSSNNAQDREGRSSIQKLLGLKIILIENDGNYDSLYLDFIERLFQRAYLNLPVQLQNVLQNDLRYTGFETKFRDEGAKLVTFCTLNFELRLEETLN